MLLTLGKIIAASKSDAILGISDRQKIIDFIERAVELAAYRANWNVWQDTMDICSDEHGVVTLPSVVGTVLQVNVGGGPTIFRSDWYSFHVNGFGDCCSTACGFSTDMGWSPTIQDCSTWNIVAAICEDAKDGDGSLKMIVEGEVTDCSGNPKEAITIPTSGASMRGVEIPLLHGVANIDAAKTYFRKITRVIKPVTRGYVKLIGFEVKQMAMTRTLGYYAPTETNPQYRRIRVGQPCKWVRIKYRRASLALVNDHDQVPLGSYQATLDLLKSIRLSDSNNPDAAEVYLNRAVRLLNEVQAIESGSTYSPLQVDPSFGVGTVDFR